MPMEWGLPDAVLHGRAHLEPKQHAAAVVGGAVAAFAYELIVLRSKHAAAE